MKKDIRVAACSNSRETDKNWAHLSRRGCVCVRMADRESLADSDELSQDILNTRGAL